MSVRGFRIWKRNDNRFQPSVLVERNGVDGSLLFQGGAIASLEESVLLAVTGVLSIGQLYSGDILRLTNVDFISLRAFDIMDSTDARITELHRLLTSQMFFFSSSPTYDLTRSAQHRKSQDGSDVRFFWNKSLHYTFERYGISTSQWLLKCMAGSVLVRVVYVGAKTGRVALISRLSCERVGTRFNVRGANYMGNVANFVETEQVLLFDETECSMIQIRGSIPLFWEQPGVQVGSHKVKLRAFETSMPAYYRHLLQLKLRYEKFAIVNLLGRKEGEKVLSDAFRTQHKNSKFADIVEFIDFDYHAQIKISKDAINHLRKKLEPHMKSYEFYLSVNDSVTRKQSGVIRTNCLDCLDRTNAVQTLIGLQMAREQIAAMRLEAGKVNVEQRVEEILKDLWQKNGDQCSTIYAGTGALDGKSKFKDASRSLARTIQNNLMDGSKQESFDLFLSGASFDSTIFDRACNLLPSSIVQEYADAVMQIVERGPQIADVNPLKIFVGTWNVNGGKNIHNVAFKNESNLSHWIFSESLVCVEDEFLADVVAIGVEELVDLNASNMMKASTTNQRLWCESIRKTLQEKAPFVMIGCEQLVGVCLFLFARPKLAPHFKDFAVASVKTGMGGATGNKGSVAFRVVVYSTSICFVCSHFAAGQNEVKDRNEDFLTAVRKIRFPFGRDIESHDVIFWLGDFNYRINLKGNEVKDCVRRGDYETLINNDQLLQQKALNNTFVGFSEGALEFAPTYKYDTFSDDYDTSEKCRAPAWTDRILWKDKRNENNADTKLIKYARSELKTSDHRPVGALFITKTYRVDNEKCIALVEDVIESMGPPDGTIIVSVEGKARFPPSIFPAIHEKIKELGTKVLLSKFEDGELWIILNSGECALAALSMDSLLIDGEVLKVRLKTPNWAYALKPHLTEMDVASASAEEMDYQVAQHNFDFDDDENEEVAQLLASTSLGVSSRSVSPSPSLSLGGPPPERPRPPSARNDPSPQNIPPRPMSMPPPSLLPPPLPPRKASNAPPVPSRHRPAPPPPPSIPKRPPGY